MKSTRRIFLKQSGFALAAVGVAPTAGPMFLRNTAFADAARGTNGRKKILICVFQRGGVDGLSMVVPHGDKEYYGLRSTDGGIALSRTGTDKVLDLDGAFGLHPSLAPLKPIYDAGHFAPIQACGSPTLTRSHFDAQDFMESAVPGDKLAREGWLARTSRYCPQDAAAKKSVFRTVALTNGMPRSLLGDSEALAIPDLRNFGIADIAPTIEEAAVAPPTIGSLTEGFESVFDQAQGDVLHGTGKESFEALKIMRELNSKPYAPAKGVKYPTTTYGYSLQQIAQLIKADVGLEIAFAEIGGWDTHAGQGAARGSLANNLAEFGQGLAALYTDLGDRMADVVILTMSEFGRTARQNGTGGTDHGTGTCFLALGGAVSGGKVLGKWPGLAPEQLYEGRDLAVTTDFRDVFGEIAQRHLGVQDLDAVFPGYQPTAKKFRGVMRT